MQTKNLGLCKGILLPVPRHFKKTWARGYITFFMLNSVEHEILNAHKYKKYLEIQHFSGSYKPKMLFFVLIDVKMPTIVGIITFISRKNSMLN